MTRTAIVLMGHGSRDEEGAREFLALVDAVAAQSSDPVTGGVLEFAGPVAPSIQHAFDRAAAWPVDEIVAQPVLLFDAWHMRFDMPEQVYQARDRHPGRRFRLGRPIGLHPEVIALARSRGREALEEGRGPDDGPVALLLVGRGSFEPEANGDLFKLCRLIWEADDAWTWVEGAFVSLARPFVPQGIDRCVRLGARTVVVLPFFLNTGILVRRIYEQARAARSRYAGVRILCARYLGVEPRVVRAVLEAASQATDPPDPVVVRQAVARARGGRGHGHSHPHHHHHHDRYHHHHHHHHDREAHPQGHEARHRQLQDGPAGEAGGGREGCP